MNVLGLSYSSDEENEERLVTSAKQISNQTEQGISKPKIPLSHKEKLPLLPNPDEILNNPLCDATQLLHKATQELHGGRIRSFGHFEGEYATTVFISVIIPKYVLQSLDTLVERMRLIVPGLKMMPVKQLENDQTSYLYKDYKLSSNKRKNDYQFIPECIEPCLDSLSPPHLFSPPPPKRSCLAPTTSSSPPLQCSERCSALADSGLNRMEFFDNQFHISLSRTIPIHRELIETLVVDLRSEIRRTLSELNYSTDSKSISHEHTLQQLPRNISHATNTNLPLCTNLSDVMLCFGGFKLFLNEEKNRTFLTIPLLNEIGGSSLVTSLIKAVDTVFCRRGLRPFHQDPKPHVSIAWAPNNQMKKMMFALWKGLKTKDNDEICNNSSSIGIKNTNNKKSDYNIEPYNKDDGHKIIEDSSVINSRKVEISFKEVPDCFHFSQSVVSVLAVIGKRSYELLPLG
uniref:U6 snRNA phosphodiesterase 1 n=1 Tax=Polytomella parva TaxID=51329 RepID=A0A7S0YMZ2_9CHLO|mmetsp:Transcript_33903/g.61212  ORF Transcript_33903/g.61212 Transcript_33903/m.61212 type:complete len:458 (+) Transcript_33903:27-1400(+)